MQYDHVVPLRRIFDRDKMIADPADVAERTDRLGRVFQQRLFESRIGPRLGDDPRAIVGADLGFIGLDDGIERRGIDVSLLGQNGFQRSHAQFGFGEFRMVVVMMVIVFGHGSSAREGLIGQQAR